MKKIDNLIKLFTVICFVFIPAKINASNWVCFSSIVKVEPVKAKPGTPREVFVHAEHKNYTGSGKVYLCIYIGQEFSCTEESSLSFINGIADTSLTLSFRIKTPGTYQIKPFLTIPGECSGDSGRGTTYTVEDETVNPPSPIVKIENMKLKDEKGSEKYFFMPGDKVVTYAEIVTSAPEIWVEWHYTGPKGRIPTMETGTLIKTSGSRTPVVWSPEIPSDAVPGSYRAEILTGSISASKDFTVGEIPSKPVADIKANGMDGIVEVAAGSDVYLTWTSQNASQCNVAPIGITGLNGSYTVKNIQSDTNYTLTCTGTGGTITDSVFVKIKKPQLKEMKAVIKADLINILIIKIETGDSGPDSIDLVCGEGVVFTRSKENGLFVIPIGKPRPQKCDIGADGYISTTLQIPQITPDVSMKEEISIVDNRKLNADLFVIKAGIGTGFEAGLDKSGFISFQTEKSFEEGIGIPEIPWNFSFQVQGDVEMVNLLKYRLSDSLSTEERTKLVAKCFWDPENATSILKTSPEMVAAKAAKKLKADVQISGINFSGEYGVDIESVYDSDKCRKRGVKIGSWWQIGLGLNFGKLFEVKNLDLKIEAPDWRTYAKTEITACEDSDGKLWFIYAEQIGDDKITIEGVVPESEPFYNTLKEIYTLENSKNKDEDFSNLSFEKIGAQIEKLYTSFEVSSFTVKETIGKVSAKLWTLSGGVGGAYTSKLGIDFNGGTVIYRPIKAFLRYGNFKSPEFTFSPQVSDEQIDKFEEALGKEINNIKQKEMANRTVISPYGNKEICNDNRITCIEAYNPNQWDVTVGVGANVTQDISNEYNVLSSEKVVVRKNNADYSSANIKYKRVINVKDGLTDFGVSIRDLELVKCEKGVCTVVEQSGIKPSSEQGEEKITFTAEAAGESVFALVTHRIASDSSQRVIHYPNPFIPSRGHKFITFSGTRNGDKIRIYTISGELIRELIANSDSLVWDVKNYSGREVVSGTYVYTVNNRQGGRITIIR